MTVDAAALPELDPHVLEALARKLKIAQLVGGATDYWRPNREQHEVWQAGWIYPRRFITKSRRRGVSTALDLEDTAWTLMADATGHRVRTGIFIHTEDKTKERIVQCVSFLEQMRAMSEQPIEFEASTFGVSFPNGSELVGNTAGGQGASRSEGYQRARYEEYAFYKTGIGEISPSVSLGSVETICTTIDIAAPNGRKAREMWDAENGYYKLFLPFDWAAEYVADPSLISDDQWAWAEGEGISTREAAAYWLTEVLPNKCEGDRVRAFREYPPTPRHMFQASEHKWIARSPKPREPLEVWRILGVRGDDWIVHVYKRPRDMIAKGLIGVDTAEGKGLDRCCALVVDPGDWTPAAIVVSDRMIFDDLAICTLELQRRYPGALALIEEIGIGSATVAHASTLGVIHDVVTPTQEGKYEGLLAAKMAVEAGLLFGPHELTVECDELHRDPKTGAFVGRKDILMSYGFAARRMKDAPWLKPKQPVRAEEKVDGARIIRSLMRQQARRWH